MTDRLLPKVPDLLSPKGMFYLVVIKENNPGTFMKERKKIVRESKRERFFFVSYSRIFHSYGDVTIASEGQ